MNRHILRRTLVPAAVIVAAMAATTSSALAVNGTLPGGTSISNTITAPPDGSTITAPPGTVTVQGNASIGMAAPKADTTLIYVIDRSGSTVDGSPGCGGNQNGDSHTNSVLDCEIAAARVLNQKAIDAGTVDEVGVIQFDTNAQVIRGLTTPGDPAVNSALGSIQAAQATNFAAAARSACTLAQSSSNPNTIVVFLSDGVSTTGGNALDDVPCAPKTATFQTFAIGSNSNCDTVGVSGSLRQIAMQTGGGCTQVDDVASLPDVVPGVIASQLTKLELTIDGGAAIDISANASAVLPKNGPTAVTYARDVTGLTAGTHTLCTRALGTDSGGAGSVQDCVTVVVKTPKVSINDVSVTEGDSGTVPATFTLSLDRAPLVTSSVKFATADGSATAADYVPANGTVTFLAGQTSKTVTIAVKGDHIDEPSEAFSVNLSDPSGLQIADDKGIGLIIDDDRNGAFACRAAGVRLLGIETSVSNPPYAPCADDDGALLKLPLGLGGLLNAGANVADTSTGQTPDDLSDTPALNDRGEADARVTGATIVAGLLFGSTIKADVVTSHAEARCVGPLGSSPQLTGSTLITGLKINGANVTVNGTMTIDLPLGTLYVNHTLKTADSVRQRGLWFKGKGLLSGLEVVLAEARAGFSGNPCAV